VEDFALDLFAGGEAADGRDDLRAQAILNADFAVAAIAAEQELVLVAAEEIAWSSSRSMELSPDPADMSPYRLYSRTGGGR
jgi:hypothetical protein